MPNRNLSIAIDPSSYAVTLTPDTDSTVFNPNTSVVCRFQDPGQSSYPRVIAVFSSAGGGTVSQWTLNPTSGYWESPSVTSTSTSGTQYTQYVKIHGLIRKTAEAEDTSTNPFNDGPGLQPIIRDARIGMDLAQPGHDEAPQSSTRGESRQQPRV